MWGDELWRETWADLEKSFVFPSPFTTVIDPKQCHVIHKSTFRVLISEMGRWLRIVYAFGAMEAPISGTT